MKDYDVKFEQYSGVKRFNVAPPPQFFKRTIVAAAPDEDSAIVAAASFLGIRWQRYDFYAYCEVTPAL